MIHEHIEQIEAKLQAAPGMPEQTRADLLAQLAALRAELESLSKSHAGDPRFEAAPQGEAAEKPATLEGALEGLTASVEGLETSHPQLTALVNRLALTLSNLGI